MSEETSQRPDELAGDGKTMIPPGGEVRGTKLSMAIVAATDTSGHTPGSSKQQDRGLIYDDATGHRVTLGQALQLAWNSEMAGTAGQTPKQQAEGAWRRLPDDWKAKMTDAGFTLDRPRRLAGMAHPVQP